jgi:Bacterial SH3 domain
MNKLFPNIETAIIVVGLLCVMLWGVSRCRKQKEDVAIRTATEGSLYPDTSSVAATKPVATSQPIAIPPTINTPVTTQTPQYSPSAPTTPAQATPQPLPQATVAPNVPTSYGNTPPANNVTIGSKAPNLSTTQAPAMAATPKAEPSGSLLYVLRNSLNIRKQPNVKAKSLGRLKLHDQVYFLNEVSDTPETVRLENGTEITKPWFKIQTKRGTVGWVHGSGVDFYIRKPHQTY